MPRTSTRRGPSAMTNPAMSTASPVPARARTERLISRTPLVGTSAAGVPSYTSARATPAAPCVGDTCTV